MKTSAVCLNGKNDLRLEEFELAPLKDNEIRVKNVTDSISLSSYKAANQGWNTETEKFVLEYFKPTM
jgi:hypothetical protein